MKKTDQEINDMSIDLFRQRLRSRLKQLDMKQYELSEKTGISTSTIEKWLGGKDDDINGGKKPLVPSLNNIYKVSQVLGVSIDYFVNPDMEYLTVSNEMIGSFTGLSDTAIDCLRGWCLDRQRAGKVHRYSNDTETLNTILEYYGNIRKDNAKKGYVNGLSLFHFIGNFFNAHKFARVQQDMIRFGNGTHFDQIEIGDTIKKHGSKKGVVIETLCTPINSKSHRGSDTSKLDIVNTENDNEQYYIELSDIFREHCKSQIISSLKKIGGIS